jgi:hypothetical protein
MNDATMNDGTMNDATMNDERRNEGDGMLARRPMHPTVDGRR